MAAPGGKTANTAAPPDAPPECDGWRLRADPAAAARRDVGRRGLGMVAVPKSVDVGHINDAEQVAGNRNGHSTLWQLRVSTAGVPAVDRLAAVLLPPGNPTGLTGVWLRVRLTDAPEDGPWTWAINWGDGPVTTTKKPVALTGESAFLRSAPYTDPGPHTITVTATDPTGLTSAPATTTAP